MASRPFPTTLADLAFPNGAASTSLYQSIRDLRRSALSLKNRLTSVVRDAEFVQSIGETYCFPIIANERCGSWYIDPKIKIGSAYFKSTDGHHGQWSFSLRRLNLQILSVIAQHGGAIIVDSTRRGKNMPDALLKTVPIWVAVMNRTLFPDRTDLHALQCPPVPDDLSNSEVSQIEARLNGFVKSFKDLQLDLQALTAILGKPISIQWAVNGGAVADRIDMGWRHELAKDQDCNHLILCSASRRVIGAEASEGGYIQGAGDDSESWAFGLTPQVFWKHQQMLLRETREENLPETITRLVRDDNTVSGTCKPTLVSPTSTLYIGPTGEDSEGRFSVIIDCTASIAATSKIVLSLGCREGKLGSRDLRDKLPAVNDFIRAALTKDDSGSILVTCSTCRDLSAGVALMILCLFYNDNGDRASNREPRTINKVFVKRRLAWISSSMPEVNPSRSTLQSVNAFLMPRS